VENSGMTAKPGGTVPEAGEAVPEAGEAVPEAGEAVPEAGEAVPEPGVARATRGIDLRRIAGGLGPFLGLILVVLLFHCLSPDTFLSLYNVKTVVTQTVIVALGALGMTLIIISGGIDLSVGSVIALTTVVTALGLDSGYGTVESFSLGLAAGVLCGLINGLAITSLKVVPFIATLGSLCIVRGVALWLADEQKVDAPATWINSLMAKNPDPPWLLLSPGIWLMIFSALAVAVLLRYTAFGRYVFATGSNESTARLCGIKVEWVKIRIYAIAGFFAGLAGLMQFSRLTVGDPTVAVGLELDIIAAVVIGGGSLSGGKGSVLGTIIGAFIMAFLRNGCVIVGVHDYVQRILIGAIIIAAVTVDLARQKKFSFQWIAPVRAFFSFRGRMSRLTFLCYFAVLKAAGLAAFFLLGNLPAVAVVLFVPETALLVKRCHDRNRSGWELLIPLLSLPGIPIFKWVQEFSRYTGELQEGGALSAPNEIGLFFLSALSVLLSVAAVAVFLVAVAGALWIVINIIFAAGTDGYNRYGPDPLKK
jgi:ribose transport system permease protein